MRLTLHALGLTEEDLWQEIRDRWRRPEGTPQGELNLRRLFKAEELEEQAHLSLAERFRLGEMLVVSAWSLFHAGRTADGWSEDQIVRAWEDPERMDRPILDQHDG